MSKIFLHMPRNRSLYSSGVVVMLMAPWLSTKFQPLMRAVIDFACVLCFAQKKSRIVPRYTYVPSEDLIPVRQVCGSGGMKGWKVGGCGALPEPGSSVLANGS